MINYNAHIWKRICSPIHFWRYECINCKVKGFEIFSAILNIKKIYSNEPISCAEQIIKSILK